MSFRLATFNVENLLRRFDFSGYRNRLNADRVLSLYAVENETQYQALEQARAIAETDDTRQLTALAIAATRADIICLQEVDDLDGLNAFERGYLFKMIGEGYRHKFVSQGNDIRGIDVGLMLRDQTAGGETMEVSGIKSHAHLTFGDLGLVTQELLDRGHEADERIFRRDCLEVELRIGGRPLTLFIVHLKSMTGGRGPTPGREASMPLREAEARAVRRIVQDRFGDDVRRAAWAICGDFNDYRERVMVGGDEDRGWTFTPVGEERSALDILLADAFAVDPMEQRPALDRWTLFHTRGPRDRHLCQLDYLLLSPALAAANPHSVPDVIRRGQPWRTVFPPGQAVERFPRTGWDRPKASDHCPVAITLDLPGEGV